MYGQLVLNRVPRPFYSFFNIWYCNNWIATYKRMKLDRYIIPYTKVNSKWIEDVNVRAKTRKFLEENKGKTHDLGLG